MNCTSRRLAKSKTIALVAHDHRKEAIIAWALKNKDILAQHNLVGTGTTATLVAKHTGLKVRPLLSGPMGGDQQVGNLVASKELDILIFFWDPFEAMPHDPDVRALLRISTVWNIPMALNESSADMIINSNLFHEKFDISIPDYEGYLNKRIDD
ncbi:MAG: methylglyoxal synthase [Psittacicella sp.]